MDEQDSSWFKVTWRNWYDPYGEQRLTCDKVTEVDYFSVTQEMTWEEEIQTKVKSPTVLVTARSFVQACDRAGQIFDKNRHLVK